jgi:hypothetical protein
LGKILTRILDEKSGWYDSIWLIIKDMKDALKKLDESINKYDNTDMKDYFINLIKDRAKNCIMIDESEGDEFDLDVSEFIKLIKEDLKDYKIVRKDTSPYCTCNTPNPDTFGESCKNCYREILY